MPFTDNFTGTDGTDLASYSSNWTRVDGSSGSATINASNQVKQNTTDTTGTSYTAPDCGTANHYGQLVVRDNLSSTTGPFAPCVRLVDRSNFIGARVASGGGEFQGYKRVAGTFTLLGNYVVSVASGDVLKTEISGTSVTIYVNGVSRITGTVSDSVFSGVTKVGIVARTAIRDPWFDDWESTQSTGTASTDLSTAGSATAIATGASIAAAAASATGSATGTLVGSAVSAGFTTADASAAGSATATARGASIASAAASANGGSTATLVGTTSGGAQSADASAAGASTATAATATIAAAAMSAGGTSTARAVGADGSQVVTTRFDGRRPKPSVVELNNRRMRQWAFAATAVLEKAA